MKVFGETEGLNTAF